MKYFLALAILGVVSLILSLCLTKILLRVLTSYGVVDVPSNRRTHVKTTPRGGGLGFVIIFITLLPAFVYYRFGTIEYVNTVLQIFLPLALVSFWDDISHVNIPIRLIIHVLCSVLAIMWLIHPKTILHSEMPIYLDLVIGAIALLTFLNVYNFLDGIDGITVSETIHLSLTLLILCFLGYDSIPNVDMIIVIDVIILGWAVGFLFFNWQPAKIFLGDIGSISIGFLLGVCLLTVATVGPRFFTACVIAALYYIADGGLTILIRIVKGEKIWEPHLQHFFQKSVKKGRSHKRVVKRIIKCNFLLMMFAIAALYYPLVSVIGALLVVIVTLIRSV
ncbi:MAG: glycosyltransferase family 4 protein [Rickettsiaceae bacterium]